MNPIKSPEINVILDRQRTMKFSWAAIDYLTDRYDSLGDAMALAQGFADPMQMTKATKNAIMDFFVALLLADDPEMTAEKLKHIMPIEKMIEIAPEISKAVKAGGIQNPQ